MLYFTGLRLQPDRRVQPRSAKLNPISHYYWLAWGPNSPPSWSPSIKPDPFSRRQLIANLAVAPRMMARIRQPYSLIPSGTGTQTKPSHCVSSSSPWWLAKSTSCQLHIQADPFQYGGSRIGGRPLIIPALPDTESTHKNPDYRNLIAWVPLDPIGRSLSCWYTQLPHPQPFRSFLLPLRRVQGCPEGQRRTTQVCIDRGEFWLELHFQYKLLCDINHDLHKMAEIRAAGAKNSFSRACSSRWLRFSVTGSLCHTLYSSEVCLCCLQGHMKFHSGGVFWIVILPYDAGEKTPYKFMHPSDDLLGPLGLMCFRTKPKVDTE